MSGANQSYPQAVNLDTAKAKAADMQSQTSKVQGGNINPTDPASKARVRFSEADALLALLTAHVPLPRFNHQRPRMTLCVPADLSEAGKAQNRLFCFLLFACFITNTRV